MQEGLCLASLCLDHKPPAHQHSRWEESAARSSEKDKLWKGNTAIKRIHVLVTQDWVEGVQSKKISETIGQFWGTKL